MRSTLQSQSSLFSAILHLVLFCPSMQLEGLAYYPFLSLKWKLPESSALCFVHCCIPSVQNTFLVCAAGVSGFPNGMSVWPLISALTHPRICEIRNRLPLVGWNSSLCTPGWGRLCLWLLNQSLSAFFLVFLLSPSYLCPPASSAVSCDALAQHQRALW